MDARVISKRRLEPAIPKRGVYGSRARACAQADDHDPQADATPYDRRDSPGVPHVPRLRRRRRPVPPVDVVPRQRRLPGLSGLRVVRPRRLVLRHDSYYTAADVSPRHDTTHGRRRMPRVSRLRGQRRLPRDVLLPRQRRLPGLPRLLLLRPARRVLRAAVSYNLYNNTRTLSLLRTRRDPRRRVRPRPVRPIKLPDLDGRYGPWI